MMKLTWNNVANTTTSKGLLRRLSSRQVVASTTTAIHQQCRSYSSLYEAPMMPPIEYEASQYGYRVVVNRFSSSLRTSMNQIHHTSSYDHHKANNNDDYDEYLRSCSGSSTIEHDNLDILASPEVQEILHSQQEWDCSLPESAMLKKGGRQLQDTILDGGDYDSDCEEMSPADWNDRCTNGRNNSVAAMTEEQLFTAEDVDEN
jgi:hypothetical protein